MITQGLNYQQLPLNINGSIQNIHVIRYEQGINENLTLLISKMSEAINPEQSGNHIGEGSTMDNLLSCQNGIRFVINGGFSHYRKDFYTWQHQDFNVGDPVGLVKIREHFFEDYVNIEHYGFLTQSDKSALWTIQKHDSLTMNEKYILGCTPLLIFDQKPTHLPDDLMKPVPDGTINPPSVLGHGLQKHPRTAVGIKGTTLYFIMVDDNQTGGCSLIDLQTIGLHLALDTLLNLDGGGSSQFRMVDNSTIIKNNIHPDDVNRILGHTLIIFDEELKKT